ncbi:hypothetical protein AMELA_G00129590 [Ameiurus melas]|uniref:Uncharacterized protein n=1 Tax=Ameiurus melas TaxID=219545 RepID=A0A7J6APL7_AMEME|nr:hypothetical protein AMELA_G00129590 [Ameiurus melas]
MDVSMDEKTLRENRRTLKGVFLNLFGCSEWKLLASASSADYRTDSSVICSCRHNSEIMASFLHHNGEMGTSSLSASDVLNTGINKPAINVNQDEKIVGATIHLDHLSKDKVLEVLKIIHTYDENVEIKTEASANAGVRFGDLFLKGDTPKLQAPSADIHGLNGNLSLPGVKGGLAAPSVNGELPQAQLKGSTPELTVGDGGKFTMPTFGMTGPKLKGANLDGSVSSPTLNSPEASYTTPAFKMPNFKGSSPDLDLNTPDVGVNLPNAELKGPNLNAELPDVDIEGPSGKFNLPKTSWGLSKPKVKPPDADLSVPNLKADIKTPGVDVNLPDTEVSSPEFGIDTPNLNTDSPSAKFKWPKFKKPKGKVKGNLGGIDADVNTPELNLSAPKMNADINAPNMDVDMNLPKAKGPTIDAKAPDLKLSAPNVKGDIGTPDLNIKTPDVDLKAPKIDAETRPIKFKLPKLPKFTGSGAKVKGPDVDANLNVPDVGVNGDVNLKTPTIDAPSAKVKKPHVKLPKFSLTGPRVKTPSVDANLQTPDVNLPSGEFKGPNLDLKAPKIDGSLAGPDIDLPKAELKNPNLNLHAKSPALNLSVPDVDLNLPKGDIKGPNIDGELNTPDVDLNLPKAKVSGPDVDVKLPKADVKVPDVDVKTPEIEAPSGKFKFFTFKKSKMSASTPKVKSPEVDVNDLSLSAPKIDADIKAPDASLNLPTANLEGPNVDIDAPKGKLKFPTLKRLNFSSPKVKSPSFDEPDLSVSAPKVESPNVDLSLPKGAVDVESPDLHVDGSKSKIKWPFKRSNHGSIGGTIDTVDANIDDREVSANADVKLPKSLPMFKTHRLPNSKFDDLQDATEAVDPVDLNTNPIKTESPSATVSVPTVPRVRAGWKSSTGTLDSNANSQSIDIKERLRLFTTRSMYNLTTPSDPASSELPDTPTNVRQGTFKVINPDSEKDHPQVNSTSKNDQLSLSLNNMLGLSSSSDTEN